MDEVISSVNLPSAYFITHLSPTPVQNPQDHMLVWNKHIVVQTLATGLEILLVSNDCGKPSFSEGLAAELIWSIILPVVIATLMKMIGSYIPHSPVLVEYFFAEFSLFLHRKRIFAPFSYILELCI